MYKYVQMPTQVLTQTRACAHTRKHTNTHTSLLPFWFLCLHRCCALWQGELWIKEDEGEEEEEEGEENPG